MNGPARLVSLLVAAALIVGCGGGGGGTATPSTPQTNGTTSQGSGAGKTPLGHASITVKYTQALGHAKLAASAKAPTTVQRATSQKGAAPKTTVAVQRPAYLNGATTNYLDIWEVNPGSNQVTKVLDSSGSGGNVNPAGDGTQSFTIALYSSDTNDIVAIEYDGDPSGSPHLLAIGETDYGGFSPGSGGFGSGGVAPTPQAGNYPQVALTMLMYVTYVGVMSDPNNANGDATDTFAGGSMSYTNNSASCCSNPVPYFLFAADAAQNFVTAQSGATSPTTGIGGVAAPTIVTSQTDATSSNVLQPDPNPSGIQTSFVSGYGVNFNNTSCGTYGLTTRVSGLNPAAAILTDISYWGNSTGSYPGAEYLYTNNYLPNSFPYVPYYLPNNTGIPTTTIDLLQENLC
jgi:hypothetical protein